MTLKLKKRFENSICFTFHLSYYYMYPTCKISHTKMHACKAAAGGPLLEISYTPLLSVVTLHYHEVYKISSLEANLSLEAL